MCRHKTILFLKMLLPLLMVLTETYPTTAIAADVTSALFKKTSDGHLMAIPDAKGNTVPDFSWVGYRNGEIDIPVVAVAITISPVAGDNLKNIQNAINTVAAMPLVNGFRGTVLLKPGNYNVSAPIKISSSGIVIRGSGTGSDGTRVTATSTTQEDGIFIFSGTGDVQLTGSSTNLRRKTVLDNYVPLGSRTLVVDSNHAFKPGDRVILKHTHNDAWIALIGMAQYGWTASSYSFDYKRNVMAVSGGKITIDAPLVEAIDKKYGNAELIAYDWPNRIENIGIENIRLDSVYSSSTDENHTWNGVTFNNSENGWVNNVDVYHTAYSAVSVGRTSSNISVLNSKMIDPVSQLAGGRRYSFNVAGQRNLIRGCYASYGRHDYVTSSRVPGPNVFTESRAVNQQSDSGPHHRWATGTLFDSLIVNGSINVQNRISVGEGHGWAGAQNMIWNCTAKKIIIQSPPGYINWAIGSLATVTDVGYVTTPGYEESTGQNVWPKSLYEQQMCDRLGKFCSENTVTVTANNQSIKQGDPLPALTYTLSLNITPDKKPVCSTAATSQSNVGNYEISCIGAEKSGYTFSYVSGSLAVTAKTSTTGTLEVAPTSTSDKNCNSASDMLYIDGSTEGKIFTPEKSFLINLPVGQHTLALASQASPIAAGGTLTGTCIGTINPKIVTVSENTKTTTAISYSYNNPVPTSQCKIISAKVDSQANWGKIVANKFTISVSLNTGSAKYPIKLTGNIVMKNPFIQNFWGDFGTTSSWSNNTGSFQGDIWRNTFTLQGYISNASLLSVGDNPLDSLKVNGITCY